MIFAATQLDDAWLINLELREDERGFFARSWCRQELAAQGLDTEIAQESLPLIGTAARRVSFISTTTLDRLAHRKQSGAPSKGPSLPGCLLGPWRQVNNEPLDPAFPDRGRFGSDDFEMPIRRRAGLRIEILKAASRESR